MRWRADEHVQVDEIIEIVEQLAAACSTASLSTEAELMLLLRLVTDLQVRLDALERRSMMRHDA